MQHFTRFALCLGCLLSISPVVSAQSEMEKQFVQPPDSAKPRVWWHWLSGNVTKEGITADLEWMHRVGIGGFQMFDGDLSTPRFVDHPLVWMTPEWKDAWQHAAAEADRLNLEMGMAASGGWSETAGPWVEPQQGMKKYVWSETSVTGPARVHTRLPQPPATVGKFQNMPAATDMAFPTPTDLPGTKPALPSPLLPATAPFYRDVHVVAYRRPIHEASSTPVITSSSSTPLDLTLLDGHDLGKTTLLRIPAAAKDGWIQFGYPQPVTTYAMTLGVGIAGGFLAPSLPVGVLEASQDGKTWKTLAELPGSPQSPTGAITLRTYAYEAVTASYYRLRVSAPAIGGAALFLGAPSPPGVTLSELVLQTSPRVNHWEDKAGFGVFLADASSSTPQLPADAAIDPHDVIDLTNRMQPDGTLDWQAPAGVWTILRFGYGLTGEKNHPATPAATGLEVDKFSREDVASYAKTYTGMISGMAGDLYGKSFRNFLMDSWEAGNANWTERMAQEFQARRGYSLTHYLPVLTGLVVGSPSKSDAFLWDFRRTLAELLAENHYGTFTAAINPSGVALYAEAMGTDLPTNGDGLLNKGNVSVPMAEFWTPAPGERDLPSHIADTREAASAAHIYGKPVAAAESFTTVGLPGWGQSPFYLKPLADENFARGINRIVIHTSDQQPFVDEAHKPGLTLGPFGQNYTRNITWAEQSVAWNTYLARTSYLLQQGTYVADVAYFYGEGSPAVVPYWKPVLPVPPTHYGFDFLNSDVLLNHSSVQGGRLQLDSGMNYALLVFPADTRMMTLPMMRKLRDLVSAGATLLAPRPDASPSLADANATTEFSKLADMIWGSTPIDPAGRVLGRGKVFDRGEIEPLLSQLSVAQDFSHSSATNIGTTLPRPMPLGDSDEDLVYLHRKAPDADIYFVATQKLRSFDTVASFRVSGREPGLWNPMTGERTPVSYKVHDGITTIPLHFEADASMFVVFGKRSAEESRSFAPASLDVAHDLSQGWALSLSKSSPSTVYQSLQSWTESSNPAVKYFSGTATYSKSVVLQAADLSDDLLLDLGDVREIAQVSINGTALDTILWAPPYRIATGHLLHPGSNTIEVRITNLWPNRLIGDEQPGAAPRQTFTSIHAFAKDSPLSPSGMLGPVVLLRSR